MIENIHEIISDYKEIKRNVENIIRDTVHDESVPLIIRAEILLDSGLGQVIPSEDEDFCLEELLYYMSNPDLPEEKLEHLYKHLEWLVNNEIVRIVKMYE